MYFSVTLENGDVSNLGGICGESWYTYVHVIAITITIENCDEIIVCTTILICILGDSANMK